MVFWLWGDLDSVACVLRKWLLGREWFPRDGEMEEGTFLGGLGVGVAEVGVDWVFVMEGGVHVGLGDLGLNEVEGVGD